MLDDKYKNRALIICALIIFVVIIFVGRLSQFQLFEDYTESAESNAFYRKTIYAPRGLIYDRNGKLLVFNQPTYDLMVTVKELNDMRRAGTPIDTLDLCNFLNISKEQFDSKMADIKNRSKNPGYSPLTPQRFITQLLPEDYATLQEHLRKFPGFSIQDRVLRNYVYPNAAHVLGSMGEVNRDMMKKDPYYKMGDYVGIDGLERTYENELRGTNGVEILLRDARGRLQGSYKEGSLDRAPIAGSNLTSTIDIELQAIAEELLQGKIGSIVAIEPKTGEILAMASSPTWNPSLLVGRSRSKYYPILLNDKTKPLLNRAVQGTYSPGSTFKILQSLVGLEMGAITEHTQFPCNGPSSKPIKCTHHHGSPVTLDQAIQESCNPYFWQTFRSILEKDGYGEKNAKFKENYEKWRNYMLSFGLGPRFDDSDVMGLRNGAIPTQKTYNKWYGERGWRAMTIRSNAIGQGEVEVTPIQLANAASAVANKGYYITPHLNKSDSLLEHRHEIPIDRRHYDIVQHGMWRMMEYGSGRWYPVSGVTMCGKTGTTDNAHGRPHSIFIGFAPYDNPQIAIAVVIENAGFGATWACPIATLCIEEYLNRHIERTELYNRMKNSILNPDVVKRF